MSATVQDVSVGSCIVALTAISDDLLSLSAALLEVEKKLQPLERAYEDE